MCLKWLFYVLVNYMTIFFSAYILDKAYLTWFVLNGEIKLIELITDIYPMFSYYQPGTRTLLSFSFVDSCQSTVSYLYHSTTEYHSSLLATRRVHIIYRFLPCYSNQTSWLHLHNKRHSNATTKLVKIMYPTKKQYI